MNSSQSKTQIDTLLANNTEGGITAIDLRTVVEDLLHKAGGFAYYENSSVTPQSVLAATWTKVTNDGAGANNITSEKPYYMSGDLLTDSEADLTELEAGTIVHNRLHFDIVTSTPNTVVKLRGINKNSAGATISTIDFDDIYYKTTGSHESTSHIMFMVNALNVGGSIEIQAYSTDAFTIVWNSVLSRIAG